MYKEKRCLTKEVPESSNHLFPLLSADATHPGRVSNNNYTPRTHAVFGCTKTSLELNWIVNSKSKMERKLFQIQIMLFGCKWNLMLESEDGTNSNFCLDVTTTKLDGLVNLDNINLCTCTKNSMCILKCIHIIFHKNTYISVWSAGNAE
jgi:hypothetical protein